MDTSKQLKAATWRKSSYSGTNGGDCVEVADLTPCVAVRDSKDPEVGTLTLSPEAYVAFIGYVGGAQ
ncbi:DUF397 domain-containing protein [Streptomyces sp. ISL-22]|uniref:DUF397 domain-containing protein n=1 Tax=unclassified Streptomyces TaxID=2593676 RepID=UPI001BE9B7C1|nr:MULTISPECIES: DUF397 domain-containing protein [unclassified Streptomyces]MBT2418607.1 DUF397 domain-containing protein [Streptomyces sp. ISL-24]MBT2434290.1 DUF397 domain-containing protein [Streptomyces sp. ISL-22]